MKIEIVSSGWLYSQQDVIRIACRS
jgi:hypothetical protein